MGKLTEQVAKQRSTLNTLNLKMETMEAKPEKNKEDDPHYKEFEGAK